MVAALSRYLDSVRDNLRLDFSVEKPIIFPDYLAKWEKTFYN